MKSGTTPSLTATVKAHRRQVQALDFQALDYLPDGIFTCQPVAGSLTVAYANAAFVELLDLPASRSVRGVQLISLIGGMLTPELLATLSRATTVRQRVILMFPAPGTEAKRLRLELRPVSGDSGTSWVGSLGLAEADSALSLESAHVVPTAGETHRAPGETTVAAGADADAVLDAIPGLVALRGADGRVGFVNTALCEFLGLDSGAILGRCWSEVTAGRSPAAAFELPPAEALAGGRPVAEPDIMLTDALGRERRFDVIHRLVRGPADGEPRIALSIATERLVPARNETPVIQRREPPARTPIEDIAQRIPGAIVRWSVGEAGERLRFISGGTRRLTGYPRADIMREPELLFSGTDRDSRAAFRRAVAQAAGNLAPFVLDFPVRHRDSGERRWLRLSAAASPAANDEILLDGLLTDVTQTKAEATEAHRASHRLAETEDRLREALSELTQDAAERKRYAETLREAQRRLDDLAAAVPGALYRGEVGTDGVPRLTCLSEGARKICGIGPEHLLGDRSLLADLIDPQDLPGLQQVLADCLESMTDFEHEFKLRDVHGEVRWVHATARPGRRDGGTVTVSGFVRDITEAKLAEKRYADGEERLALALENGGLGLLDWDLVTGRVICNSRLVKLLGYGYDEMGTSIEWLHDLEHPVDSARKRTVLQAYLDGKTPGFSCTYRLRTKRGEWRWVAARGRVVARDRDGRALRYIGTLQDATDRMDAERRLVRQVLFARLITKISSDLMDLKADQIDRALSEALQIIARFADAQQAYLYEERDSSCTAVRTARAAFPAEKPGCVSGRWQWVRRRAAARGLVEAPNVEELPEEAAAEKEDCRRRGVASFRVVPLFIGDQGLGWLGLEFAEPGGRWEEGEPSLFRMAGEIIAQTIIRKHRERALEAAEAQVREIARAVPGTVAQVYRSPKGRVEFRYLSATLTEVSVEDAMADPAVLLERIDQRDKRGFVVSLAKAAADLTPWHYDYRTRMQNGETLWVSASAYPTRLPDGGTLFNGIATDVTERKRSEAALQRSRERFRDLYESTPVMLHSTDARGRIVNVNREWLATLGYSRSEVLGRRTEDFLTRASCRTLESTLRDLSALEHHDVQNQSCQMVKRDGRLIDVVLSMRAERTRNRFVGASMSLLNVTERNQALRSLEESEERYRAVVRDQTDAICRFDRSGSVQFANEPCFRLFGGGAVAVTGLSWFSWIDPAQRERIRQKLEEMSHKDSQLQLELRMSEAQNRWYQWTIRGFFAEDGGLTGYQAVGRDIQELKQLETEIREISHREQQRIGHEIHDGLGQELTGISLMLKTLEQAVDVRAPELRAKVSAVRDMVGQTIATARAVAQGLSPVHLERDGFAGALSQLVANTESVYGTPVRFRMIRGGSVADASITTDLYRIAQEALSNAARHACASEIAVTLTIDSRNIVLEVADDGRGLPGGARESDGMGLKIMRYRAGMIGASLDILPRDGGGTIVRCTLQQPAAVKHGGDHRGTI